MLISINFFFSSLHLKTRIAFCVCVCGIGHTARNYLRLMRERQQDCLFVFALVVGVCESILGNYNISYVRVIFFFVFLCLFFCLVFWYFARDGVSSSLQANTYKCWLARLPEAPPAPLNLCCSFWYLMGDWMALRKSRCDWRICLMVSTHSLVASGLGA